MEKTTDTKSLENGCYCKVNGMKKKLYWQDGEWFRPIKDSRGNYSGNLESLPKQPNFKFAEKIELTDLYE